jgi:hypothetical protein
MDSANLLFGRLRLPPPPALLWKMKLLNYSKAFFARWALLGLTALPICTFWLITGEQLTGGVIDNTLLLLSAGCFHNGRQLKIDMKLLYKEIEGIQNRRCKRSCSCWLLLKHLHTEKCYDLRLQAAWLLCWWDDENESEESKTKEIDEQNKSKRVIRSSGSAKLWI